MPIPKRIIQTHYSKALAATSRASWLAHHPDFEYCFFNDAACRHFMAQHFANLVAVYDRLPLPVQKADMFRYAALLTLGGVYADADTLCCSSLPTYANLDSDMMLVGVEMRPDHYLDGIDTYSPTYPIPHQILQWTFAASPHHPMLAVMLQRIAYYVSQMTQQQLEDYSRSTRFTLELTGPILFSQVCNEFLSGTREGTIEVLPRMAWGAWPQEQANPQLKDLIKVRHLFAGSWKTQSTAPIQASVRYQFQLGKHSL